MNLKPDDSELQRIAKQEALALRKSAEQEALDTAKVRESEVQDETERKLLPISQGCSQKNILLSLDQASVVTWIFPFDSYTHVLTSCTKTVIRYLLVFTSQLLHHRNHIIHLHLALDRVFSSADIDGSIHSFVLTHNTLKVVLGHLSVSGLLLECIFRGVDINIEALIIL